MDSKAVLGRAIVFGGCGFLGSYVVQELSRRGYGVRIFDSNFKSPALTDDVIIGDITDEVAVREAVAGCDFVYNFASIADIDEASEDPARAASVNVMGTVNSLEAARACNVSRYVLASSVYVFSKSGGIYRASKQSAEVFAEVYQERFGLPFTILRYGSLYGRGSDHRNTIARMIRECLRDGIITYDGSSDAIREYIHVEDAAKLSVDILGDKYANRHVLLTGKERLHVSEVMTMIAEMAPQRPKIVVNESNSELHYSITPYNFQPRLGHKLTAEDFVDMGQGILDCFAEAFEDQQADGNL